MRRIGGQYRFDADAFERWLAAEPTPGHPPAQIINTPTRPPVKVDKKAA